MWIAPHAYLPAAPAASRAHHLAAARAAFADFRPLLAANVARQRDQLRRMRAAGSIRHRELMSRSIGAVGRSVAALRRAVAQQQPS